ncbi:MAG: ACP S-malonyltransferase [Spirochaetales bacterium]|nr:ACP S-malonyltransferase [Spirochaetales bacterium]
MKIALVFPGQGSQVKGMGKDILDKYPKGYEIIGEANCCLNYDMEKLIMEDPDNQLNSTQFTQPALYTVCAIYTNYLKEKGVNWHVTAGHSLGEYAALYAAGAFSFIDGLKLVAKRGELMGGVNDPAVGMGAVVGITGDEVSKAMAGFDNIYIANLNAPEQTVVSGNKEEIAQLGGKLKEAGKGRLIPLRVSGAFHSPFMKPVEEEFIKAIEACPFSDTAMDIYPNVKAAPVRDREIIKQCLIEQITGQVKWTATVSRMEKDGITHHFEAGPGKVLAGLMGKCSDTITPLEIEI